MADFGFEGLKLTRAGEQFMNELSKLSKMEIRCGFQEGERGSKPYEDGLTVAQVAAFNEYGTSTIPARPFMKQAWENHGNELKQACQQANNMILNGKTAENAAAMLGAYGVRLIQEEIVDGGFAPNAPSTIRKKKSDTPLIDTGNMRQSVKYVVKRGGE